MASPGDETTSLLDQPLAFAWRDGTEPLHAAWGSEESGGGPLRLNLRHFHGNGPRRPQEASLWSDFPEAAELAPEHHFVGEIPKAAPLESVHLPPPWETLDRADWDLYCAAIDDILGYGEVKKIVPARPVFHPLQRPVIERLLRELPARLFAEPQAGSYRFLVKHGESVFFGASPELLFRREQGKIFVPAIAGTRAHGPGRATIEEASAALLASVKDRDEQAFVSEGIAESLKRLNLKPRAPAGPTVLRARNLVHLYTPIEAEDPGQGQLSNEALIAALHPTPAVGGLPRQLAQDFIGLNEPWDRGLFASPLLFSTEQRQICIVAIRSGLLDSTGLHLFAGAGYVLGSSAEGEWEETARKFESLRGLIKEGR